MNNESQLQLVYLSDALDQVLADPGAAYVWHQLAPLLANCGQELQEQVLQLLQKNVPQHGIPAFLHQSLRASILRRTEEYQLAGQALLALQTPHLDRIQAFIALCWARMLESNADMAAFVSAMQKCMIPALIARMAGMLQQAASQQPTRRIPGEIKKVAVLTSHLGSLHHAPTRLMLQHVAMLMEMGMQVELFCCQEMLVPHMPQLLGNGEDCTVAVGELSEWSQVLPQSLPLHIGNRRLGLLRRFANMTENLVHYDPDLVFMVGMYSPLQEWMYNFRPCLALATHATAPIASCDTWLSADSRLSGKVLGLWGDDFKLGPAFHYPWRIRLNPVQACSRDMLGLPPQATVLVIAGYRLAQEIQGEWAQRMLHMLQQHPDLILLLVGDDSQTPPALAHAPEGQVRLLPHQENLGGIYACCDIYVNPARMGGGFSVLEAMGNGLPVLALAGGDGGKKLQQYAHKDLDAYFAQLATWLRDSSAREQAGRQQKVMYFQQYDLASASSALKLAMEQARTHAQTRLKAVQS